MFKDQEEKHSERLSAVTNGWQNLTYIVSLPFLVIELTFLAGKTFFCQIFGGLGICIYFELVI